MKHDHIRQFREARGLSGETVAAALGISKQLYSFYETGARPIPLTTLQRIAVAFGLTVDALTAGIDVPVLTLPSAHFRTESANWASDTRAQLLWLDGALRFYTELLDELGATARGAVESPMSPTPKRPGRGDAERAARRVRDHLGLGNGTLPALFNLADRDVMTFRLPLGADLSSAPSGLFFKDPKAGLTIVVNADLTVGRQHFTFAHELAHAYFHSHQSGGIASLNASTDSRERFANDFAREFLMPSDLVHAMIEARAEWSSDPSQAGVVIELQRVFQVSFVAMAVQLRRLDRITQEQLTELSKTSPSRLATQLGLPTSPLDRRPAALHRFEQIPSTYRWLLIRAIDKGAASVGDVASALAVSTEDVRRLVDAAPAATDDELALNHADLALAN